MKLRSGRDKRLSKRLESAAAILSIAPDLMGSVTASLHGVVVPERVQSGPAAEDAVPLDGLPPASHPT